MCGTLLKRGVTLKPTLPQLPGAPPGPPSALLPALRGLLGGLDPGAALAAPTPPRSPLLGAPTPALLLLLFAAVAPS